MAKAKTAKKKPAKAKPAKAKAKPEKAKPISIGDDPLRGRDWRWRRVKYLLTKAPGTDNVRRCAPFDDKIIKRGKAYLQLKLKLTKNIANNKRSTSSDVDFALMPLRQHWPDILKAESIWQEAQFQRWVIEALVLADVPSEEIALSFGCAKNIIDAYETYFYDVRSRLSSDLFIVGELLAPMLAKNTTPENDCDFFWKAIAYRGGANMVRPFFAYKTIPAEIRGEIDTFINDMHYKAVARASTVRAPNQYNAHEIMEEHIATKQLDVNSQALTNTAEQMASGAQAMLSAIGFAVASVNNVGDAHVEQRIGKTIKVLADDGNSGNNDKDGDTPKANALPPSNIMASRLAEKAGEATEVKKEERVPKSEPKVKKAKASVRQQVPARAKPNAVVVEPLSIEETVRAEAQQDAKDGASAKKQAALARMRKKKK